MLAGALVKRVGTGGSAERLADDYPELDPRVLKRLLQDYVAHLVKHFGSTQALRQALLDGDFYALADPMAS